MRVLGLVPARGGSKGVPRKNVRLAGGRPLLAYTADAALRARRLSRVVLSTDDPEIASVGVQCGLEVPFLRPPELASDKTPMVPVAQHAVGMLSSAGDHFDAVCLLQPTAPLRSPELIDGCIEMMESGHLDAVFTVLSVPLEYNPHWVFFENGDGTLRLSTGRSDPVPRRQDLPRAVHRDGSVYVTRTDILMSRSSLYGTRFAGFPVNLSRTVNIDTLQDFERFERMLAADDARSPQESGICAE